MRKERALPLTPTQENLWIEWKLTPQSTALQNFLSFRIEGNLDIKRFQEAHEAGLNFFEATRTYFREDDHGHPEQVILDTTDMTLEMIDLQKECSSLEECQKKAIILMESELNSPLHLESSPVTFTKLITCSDEEHYYFSIIPHILSDGASAMIWMKALSIAYNQGAGALEEVFGSQEDRMAQYLASSQEYLTQEYLEEGEKYWFNTLEDAQFSLDFGHVKESQAPWLGKRKRFSLSKELTKAVSGLSRQHRTTLFTVLSAAYGALLHRYTGTEHFFLTYPVNIRRPQFKHLFSFVVNYLPLRIDLTNKSTFSALIDQVHARRKQDNQYKDIPLSKIAHAERELVGEFEGLFTNCSIMQTTFNLSGIELEGLKTQGLEYEHRGVQDDLSLLYEMVDGQLELAFDYRSSVFDDATIERMTHHFRELVAHVSEHPNTPIDKLEMLTADEKKAVMVEWNQTKAAYSKEMLIHEWFETQVDKTPDNIALIFEEQQISYQELDHRANQLAHYLQSKGVGQESRVGIALHRSPELLIGLLAILKAGGTYVPLNPNYPKARIKYIIEDCTPQAIIATSDLQDLLPESNAELCLLDLEKESVAQCETTRVERATSEHHLAYIIYTSGSTGKPKGVMLSHQNVVCRIHWEQGYFQLSENDAVLQNTTYGFDISVSELFWPIGTGARLVMLKPGGYQDPDYMIDLINQHQVTLVDFAPSALNVFIRRLQAGYCQSLKHILNVGEAYSPALAKRLKEKLDIQYYNAYGPTEAAIYSTIAPLTVDNHPELVLFGKPIDNTTVYILNEAMQPQPIGVVGELYIGGDGVAKGYLNLPELSEERFIKDPFSDHEQARLYKSGDVCRYLADGNIEFLGRTDFQVKIRGHRIDLAEIETLLMDQEYVKEAVVFPQEYDADDVRLIAYIRCPKEHFDQQALKWSLEEHLPDYMIPSAFVYMEEFPHNSSGKLDRKKLPKPSLDIEHEHDYVAPQSEIECQMAEIWASILHAKKVGVHDNFFDLGGDSLLAVEVATVMGTELEIDIPIPLIFSHPTIQEIVEALESPAYKALQRKGSKVLSTIEEVDFEQEAVLDTDISPKEEQAFIPLSEASNILMTGATGFVGSYFLAALLKQSQARIYCLVRAENMENAKQRLIDSLQPHGQWEDKDLDRLEPVIGDLAKERLGVNAEQWQHLEQTIDVIYNIGAVVNFVQSYEYHKVANVNAVKDLLQLCCCGKAKSLHHLSTMGVFESSDYLDLDVIDESTPLRGAENLHNGYTKSKWVAEKLIEQAMERNIQANIYRFALTFGDPKIGVINTEDMLHNFIKGNVQLQYAPDLELDFYYTDVNYIVRSVLCLSDLKPKENERHYHVIAANAFSLNDVMTWTKHYGYPIEQVPYAIWRRELVESLRRNEPNALHQMLPLFTEHIGDTGQSIAELLVRGSFPDFKTSYSAELLRKNNVMPADTTEGSFKTYLQFLEYKEVLPSAGWTHQLALYVKHWIEDHF